MTIFLLNSLNPINIVVIISHPSQSNWTFYHQFSISTSCIKVINCILSLLFLAVKSCSLNLNTANIRKIFNFTNFLQIGSSFPSFRWSPILIVVSGFIQVLKSFLVVFSDCTPLHGFAYLGHNRNRLEDAFW